MTKSTQTILVVGATGATGKHLVTHLLECDYQVRVIVRSASKLPEAVREHANLRVTEASLLDLSDAELMEHVKGCDAVASCLGHSLNFKGMYGHPRKLVTDAVRRLCTAIKQQEKSESEHGKNVKFLLMNTAGNRNADMHETVSLAERMVVGLIRVMVPPHADNEQAADYLRTTIGQSDTDISWVVVRPDTLLNDDTVTPYTLHASPTRSAIFNAGQTNRINVAHFMASLVTDDSLWQTWQGRMPVIYNTSTT